MCDLDGDDVIQSHNYNSGTKKGKDFNFELLKRCLLYNYMKVVYLRIKFSLKFLLAFFKFSHSPIQICSKQNLLMKKTSDVMF